MTKITDTKKKILEKFNYIFGDGDKTPAPGTLGNYRDYLTQSLDSLEKVVKKDIKKLCPHDRCLNCCKVCKELTMYNSVYKSQEEDETR